MSVMVSARGGCVLVFVVLVVAGGVVLAASQENDEGDNKNSTSSNNMTNNDNDTNVTSRDGVEGLSQLRFFQLSDIHMDTLYSELGDRSQKCHSVNGSADMAERLGKYGDFMCDPPLELMRSAIRQMKRVLPDPDFILWTGDTSPHWAKPGPSWSYVYTSLRNVSSLLRATFPSTKIVPLLGNHDAAPSNAFPVSNVDNMYDPYIEQAGWDALIADEEAQTSFKENCGFYVVDVKADLRVIVLNTNMYYSNPMVEKDDLDPCNQLSNFEQALVKASESETIKHVLVATHVPPGFSERMKFQIFPMFNVQNELGQNLTQRFVNLLIDKRWRGKIRASFFGHTHADSFRLFMDHHKVKVVGFIASSVTPHMGLVEGVNPSFRVYDFDNESGVILDYHMHVFNLSLANNKSVDKEGSDRRSRNSKFLNTVNNEDELDAFWTLGYSASEAFEVPDLSPSRMHEAYNSMLYNASGSVFRKYYEHNSVLHNNEGEDFFHCNASCHSREMCAITNFLVQDITDCMLSLGNNNDTLMQTASTNDDVGNSVTTHDDISTIDLISEDKASTRRPSKEQAKDTTKSDLTLDKESQEKKLSSSSSFSFFPLLLLLTASTLVSLAFLAVWRRVRRQRARAQEFLLTDSVFKYDGYSQVDDF